jgi:hypothetical protein
LGKVIGKGSRRVLLVGSVSLSVLDESCGRFLLRAVAPLRQLLAKRITSI